MLVMMSFLFLLMKKAKLICWLGLEKRSKLKISKNSKTLFWICIKSIFKATIHILTTITVVCKSRLVNWISIVRANWRMTKSVKLIIRDSWFNKYFIKTFWNRKKKNRIWIVLFIIRLVQESKKSWVVALILKSSRILLCLTATKTKNR